MFAVAGLILCATVGAHEPMATSCEPPLRPENEQDDIAWQRFLDEIDAFRECANYAMQRHQEAAQQHQQAARAAVDKWNRFVHGSLNAPQDFPHEPDSP